MKLLGMYAKSVLALNMQDEEFVHNLPKEERKTLKS